MISAWTKHISNDEDKERFKSAVLGSKLVLQRLQALMDEMKTDTENQELSTKLYDSPSWAFIQADANGYKRCLKQISKLINLDQG
jgi:hypothetical protein